jgi:hypothetical protein
MKTMPYVIQKRNVLGDDNVARFMNMRDALNYAEFLSAQTDYEILVMFIRGKDRKGVIAEYEGGKRTKYVYHGAA